MMDRLLYVEEQLDNYLAKVERRNRFLDNNKNAPGFKALRDTIGSAIKQQATKVADDFKSHNDPRMWDDSFNPLTPDQQVRLRGWVDRHMPRMSSLVDRNQIVNYFTNLFTEAVKARYRQNGFVVKAGVQFDITNAKYLAQIQQNTDFLLNESNIDDTTRERIISIIQDGKTAGMSPFEIAQEITDQFGDISQSRAMTIARTESANIAGQADLASAIENGVETKNWVTAGDNPCPICQDNEDAGDIPVGDEFPSGDDTVPGHPNCECYVNWSSSTDYAALADQLWDGS